MDNKTSNIINEVKKAVVGKDEVIYNTLMAMLADGHILIDDIPGVGKTNMAVAVSRALGLDCRRIQFTPDVLPSDIVGFSIYDRVSESFRYQPGVIVGTNILLGDEINRTSSRTQSALLEAMEEKQVTVDGKTYQLEKPFIVIATQNNVGTAGTQPLPQAQLDRFLIKLNIGYPDVDSEVQIMKDRQEDNPLMNICQVVEKEELLQLQEMVDKVHVEESILRYIAHIAKATRQNETVELGISPRGAIAVNKTAKARAFMEGRDYVIPEDVLYVLPHVCPHRMLLKRGTLNSNYSTNEVIMEIVDSVASPDKGKLSL